MKPLYSSYVLKAKTLETTTKHTNEHWWFPKSLTFQETDVCSTRKMGKGIYYYLCYAVLFQFLPVGRPVVQSYDGRYAPLPKPKQGSLVRDDKLQRHRTPSRSPDHHRVEININRAFDIGVREREIRSAIHNKAAPTLFPDDLPQMPAVYAGDFHFDARYYYY